MAQTSRPMLQHFVCPKLASAQSLLVGSYGSFAAQQQQQQLLLLQQLPWISESQSSMPFILN